MKSTGEHNYCGDQGGFMKRMIMFIVCMFLVCMFLVVNVANAQETVELCSIKSKLAGNLAREKYRGVSLRQTIENVYSVIEKTTPEQDKDQVKAVYLEFAIQAYDVPYVTTEEAQATCIQILEDSVMSRCLRANQ